MSPYVAPGIRAGEVVLVRPEPIEFYKLRVAEYYGLLPEKLEHKTRKREIVKARHIAMHLAYKYGDFSLKYIGEAFGGRDHTTVINAKQAVKDLSFSDERYKMEVEYIENNLYDSSTVGQFKQV